MRGRRDGRGVGRRRRRKQRAQGGPPTAKAMLAGACAERTRNMFTMVVTLDVSKLSGWLNVAATCRVRQPRLHPPPGPRLATRQGAMVFNQPLSFDTSSVTSMVQMFTVRFARALTPALS